MSVEKHGRWTPAEKLEVVKAFQQGVNIKDLMSLFHLSGQTIYKWVRTFEKSGTFGLESAARPRPREVRTKTALAQKIISKLPRDREAGIGKTQGLLYRYGFLNLARDTVRKLLRKDGRPPLPRSPGHRNKPVRVRRFEMSKPNQLWQTS